MNGLNYALDLLEMSSFYHSVDFIDNKKLELTKVASIIVFSSLKLKV